MDNLPVYIYALYAPDDPYNIRYIGKTTQQLKARLRSHTYNKRRNPHLINWIKHLKNNGLTPCIKLIDITDDKHWQDIEKFYIKSYKESGFKLINATSGGDQMPSRKGSKHTDSTKLKLSLANKSGGGMTGKHHTEESKLKIRAQTGWKHSPEAKEKMRQAKLIATPRSRNASGQFI